MHIIRSRTSPALVCLLLGLAATPAAAAHPSDFRIRLATGAELDPATAAAATPAPRTRTLLVHYANADPVAARAAITAAGASVVSYIPDRTFLVRTPAGVTLRAGGPIAWIGDYRPAYAISPALARDAAPEATIDVLLFADADLAAFATRVAGLGGAVLLTGDNGINRIARVRIARAAIAALAAADGVRWMEPHRDAVPANDRAQWAVQGDVPDQRPLWDHGLHGEDQFVGITDTGIDMSHVMFDDPTTPSTQFSELPGHRKVVAYRDGSNNPNVTFGDHVGCNFHGTHVACTITGNDDGFGASPLDGIAKAAKIFFMDLSGPTLLNGVDPFPDLNDLFQSLWDGSGSGTPHVACNAWSYPTDGAYTMSAMQVDQFAAAHRDFMILYANGDQGPSGHVGSPASAKDAVSVGAAGDGAEVATTLDPLGSIGPTADGRIKPTLVAPGIDLLSAMNGPANYSTYSGSSAAVAAATGAALLIRQYVCDGWYPTGAPVLGNSFPPSAALLKAMMIAAATRPVAGHVAPDDAIGYGRIDAANVCFFAGDTRRLMLVDEATPLAQGGSREFTITLARGERPLTAVLCWTDPAGDPAASVQLVNDLDLTLRRGAEVYKGNVFAGGWSATGGTRDARNVEEVAALAAPGPGVWTLRVDATSVPSGTQSFAICVTYDDTPVAGVQPPPERLRIALLGANPARRGASFSIDLPATGDAALDIFAADGRRVRRAFEGALPAGRRRVDWDGRDGDGRDAGSGVYWARLTAPGGVTRVRFAMLR
ncbi:MAG: S8 family serine peptidase [Candidatus Eisenbacteria bacterium]|nr:S8 family serine peptidase [Candidatus Eisenbacteria bacterium]